MSTLTITCHTAGCLNDGLPIVIEYDPADPPDAAQCGPCAVSPLTCR